MPSIANEILIETLCIYGSLKPDSLKDCPRAYAAARYACARLLATKKYCNKTIAELLGIGYDTVLRYKIEYQQAANDWGPDSQKSLIEKTYYPDGCEQETNTRKRINGSDSELPESKRGVCDKGEQHRDAQERALDIQHHTEGDTRHHGSVQRQASRNRSEDRQGQTVRLSEAV